MTRKQFFPAWGLALLVGLLVCIPEWLPWLNTPEGMSWSPFHNLNYKLSDSYALAPTVAKISQGLPFNSLSEIPRLGPYLFAALPSLVVDDFRFIYLLGYFLSFALLYWFSYKMLDLLGVKYAKTIPLFMIGFFAIWEFWPSCAGIYDAYPSLKSWLDGSYQGMKFGFRSLFHLPYLDRISAYRYMNSAHAAPLFLGYTYLLLCVGHRQDRWLTALMLLISPLMFFTYPTHTLVAYLLIAFFASFHLLRGEFKIALHYIIIGSFTLGVLIVFNLPAMVKSFYEMHPIVKSIYGDIWSNKPFTMKGFLQGIFYNKYLLCLIGAWFVFKDNAKLKWMTVFLAFCGIIFSGVFENLFNSSFYSRFLGRGIDTLFFLFAVTLLAGLLEKLLRPVQQAKVFMSVLMLLLFFPIYGLVQLGVQQTKTQSSYIPQEKAQAYQWIKKNLDKHHTKMVSFNVTDITLLPLYTQSKMPFGHVDVNAHSLDEEMQQYLGYSALSQRTIETLREEFKQAPALYSYYVNHLYNYQPPYMDVEQFKVATLLQRLFYYPYVKDFLNMPIVDAGEFNPAILQYIEQSFAKLDLVDFAKKAHGTYLMIHQDDHIQLTQSSAWHFDLVYSQGGQQIYCLQSLSS